MKAVVDLEAAHKHCIRHREEVLSSEVCGCFYCQDTFSPSQIKEWTDNGQTALCPLCGIDSVIGSQAGYPITKDFLAAMYDRWFG